MIVLYMGSLWWRERDDCALHVKFRGRERDDCALHGKFRGRERDDCALHGKFRVERER